MEDMRLRKKNLILFPLGTIGRDMVYNLFASQLLTFVLFTRFLTAAQLTAITAIMVAARVFDALNDPIMGNIIERTRSRYGKFKPWLVIGILSTSVVVYLMFNTKLQGWGFVWFFGLMYFLYSITYTMHDISYWGMVASLSSDADARNQFTSRATLFAGIGGASGGDGDRSSRAHTKTLFQSLHQLRHFKNRQTLDVRDELFHFGINNTVFLGHVGILHLHVNYATASFFFATASRT